MEHSNSEERDQIDRPPVRQERNLRPNRAQALKLSSPTIGGACRRLHPIGPNRLRVLRLLKSRGRAIRQRLMSIFADGQIYFR